MILWYGGVIVGVNMQMENQKEAILNLVDDLIHKCGFIAEITIVIPRGYLKTTLDVLTNHEKLLNQHNISWYIKQVSDGGVVLKIDRTNRPHMKGWCE